MGLKSFFITSNIINTIKIPAVYTCPSMTSDTSFGLTLPLLRTSFTHAAPSSWAGTLDKEPRKAPVMLNFNFIQL